MKIVSSTPLFSRDRDAHWSGFPISVQPTAMMTGVAQDAADAAVRQVSRWREPDS